MRRCWQQLRVCWTTNETVGRLRLGGMLLFKVWALGLVQSCAGGGRGGSYYQEDVRLLPGPFPCQVLCAGKHNAAKSVTQCQPHLNYVLPVFMCPVDRLQAEASQRAIEAAGSLAAAGAGESTAAAEQLHEVFFGRPTASMPALFQAVAGQARAIRYVYPVLHPVLQAFLRLHLLRKLLCLLGFPPPAKVP
jgi:hypothetical protein